MKWFLVLIACLAAARNLRLCSQGKTYRWKFLIFWVGFAVLVVMRPRASWMILGALLWLAMARKSIVPPLLLLGWLAWRVIKETWEDLSLRAAVLLACVLGRTVLVVYKDHDELASLVETRVLPRVGSRAIIIKNGLVARRHCFHHLDCLAFQLVADRAPAFSLVRLRPASASFWHYDLRKALWMSKNEVPSQLERILADALDRSSRFQAAAGR